MNKDIQAIESIFRLCDQLRGSSGSRDGVGTAIIEVAEVRVMVPGVLLMSSMAQVKMSSVGSNRG